MAKSKNGKSKAPREASTYRHPEADSPLRPEVGTQPQFKKRKPPVTYRYDSSLSPELNWDGQNHAREAGEALIREILEANSLEGAKHAAERLKAMSGPFLNWAGKAERLSFDVPTLPLFVHERLSTKGIIETLKGHKLDPQLGLNLFGDPGRSITDQVLKAYEYRDEWVNRMILGDSLVVMNSLLHYEGLGGQVQMIYIDPPYGVNFGSNFQPFIRKRDVSHNDDDVPSNKGRPSLSGPGKLEKVDLNPYRSGRRFQELVFDMAAELTREYVSRRECEAPAHVLFPQLRQMVDRYLQERVLPLPPAETIDVFCSPYYGWVIEHLRDAIKPDISQGEAPIVPIYEARRGPGSTGEVDFWTSREVREVVKSHINYVVVDTRTWEESAAYLIDTNDAVDAFVKNAGLGFAIPYFYNGEAHDYVPDFIVRLKTEPPLYLIIEVKGYDERADIKVQAAQKWVDAVSADGAYGRWAYGLARKPSEVRELIAEVRQRISASGSLTS